VTLADGEMITAEEQLRRMMATGALMDLREGDPTADQPRHGAQWGSERTVPAELLAELLTQQSGSQPPPRALRLAGARIIGVLDLEATELRCPVLLQDCWFERPVNLAEARAWSLRLPGCHLPGLHAEQLATGGNLDLNDGFSSHGEVNLLGAHIGGLLRFTGATLTNPNGRALFADRITVDHSVFCSGGFTASGEVSLGGAQIAGRLSFNGATLTNPSGLALDGDGLVVGRRMLCSEGFTATGPVSLNGAQIARSLSFAAARLRSHRSSEYALLADSLAVDGDMLCDGLIADGGIVVGGHIRGVLSFEGATLNNHGGRALVSDGLIVDKVMFCRKGFAADGEVRLPAARIGGRLYFDGAKLSNPGGRALVASRLTVGQDLFCRKQPAAAGPQGFMAEGEINLRGAHIGGDLDCSGAALSNPNGHALDGDGLVVEHDLRCTEGFAAKGVVNLRGARVGGQLSFAGATLSDPNQRTLALQELDARVLVLRPRNAPNGHVDLTHAHVRVLEDAQTTWASSLGLWDFVYDVLHEDPKVDVAARLDWLARDPRGYAPQPYEQLAAVYRKAGRDEDARRISIAKQRARRRTLGLPSRLWNLLLDVLVGYGYRTWLAGVWLLALWAVGTLVFAIAYPHQLMLARTGVPHPAFQPAVYALDVLLPVVDLNQQANWIPEGAARWFAWAAILAGWVLTTAILATLSGILKRD
jgi:hypothetical protein